MTFQESIEAPLDIYIMASVDINDVSHIFKLVSLIRATIDNDKKDDAKNLSQFISTHPDVWRSVKLFLPELHVKRSADIFI